MSAICPNCGAAIDLILPQNLPQTAASADPKLPQTAATRGNLSMGLDLDLDPSPNGKSQVKGQNQIYPYDFELWWKHYPLHKGKRKAAASYRKAVQQITATTGATRPEAQAQLIAAARRYTEQIEREGVERIKWAEGWLNDARWEDEDAPAAKAKAMVGTPEWAEEMARRGR